MKKIRYFIFDRKSLFSNAVIAFVLATIFCVSFVGANYVRAAKIINGVYYSGDESSNKVTLMINVYWGTEYLDKMLEVLDENDVKTTFFVGGTWAVKESEMLKKIYAKGHEIGNHGYYHKNHSKLSLQANIEEISNTHNIVESLIGVKMQLFAPPSGEYSKATVEAANGLGYKTIMWTDGRDTIDWRDKDEDLIFKRAIKNCKGGDFVLMHPTEATANALDRIIKHLKNEGFCLCTVSENLCL